VGERHFIVDWKTNMLPAYDSETLLADMRRNRYVEQYELYSLALARWLARRYGERFDPSRRLGGVYYLYVRGLNGRDDASGVFYAAPPTPDELSRLLADAELRGGQQ
jgi:exodeoxyribonuclease V beta subunit